MNAGAEDMQRAEGEDGVLEGYKACYTLCVICRRTGFCPFSLA